MSMMLLLIGAVAAAPTAAMPSVAILTHAVEKGETLAPGDFELVAPSATARSGISPAQASGMEAARRLRQGMAVQATDLVRPRVVRRGDVVTISFVSGPLTITASGRALADAGRGAPVRVVNFSTNHTIDAVAEKPGHVVLPN